MQTPFVDDADLWFVYDGACPICRWGAGRVDVPASSGALRALDARTEAGHPVIQEITAARLDLDAGMVIRYRGQFYQGAQALALVGKIGTQAGMVRRFLLSARVCALYYPLLRGARNMLLALRGIDPIRNVRG